jgi:uncharacterized iron-regulated membrane protein
MNPKMATSHLPSADDANQKKRFCTSRLYALFWRWHFITGFFAVPFLIVIALSGAAIVFRDELHPVIYPRLDLVEPSPGSGVPLDTQLSALRAAFPNDRVTSLTVYPAGSGRSTVAMLHLHSTHGDFFNPWSMGWAYVSPANGKVLSSLSASQDILEFLTTLHKSFFLMLPGELIVDLATSWGVISLLAGVYLWWPRRKEKIWGVWLPRFKGSPWLILRDLHTVPAMYITPVAIAVLVSGILLGLSAAPIFLTLLATRQLPMEMIFPPKITVPENTQLASLEDILSRMGPRPGSEPYVISLPSSPTGYVMVWYGMHTDPVNYRQVLVDPYSGKFMADYTPQAIPAGGRFYYLYIFSEVIHLGTVWGMTGKILAFIACILVAGMSITSWLIWFRRKPASSWGFPKVVKDVAFPTWVKVAFILGAILLPLVGITMLLVFLGEWSVKIFSKMRNP